MPPLTIMLRPLMPHNDSDDTINKWNDEMDESNQIKQRGKNEEDNKKRQTSFHFVDESMNQ